MNTLTGLTAAFVATGESVAERIREDCGTGSYYRSSCTQSGAYWKRKGRFVPEGALTIDVKDIPQTGDEAQAAGEAAYEAL